MNMNKYKLMNRILIEEKTFEMSAQEEMDFAEAEMDRYLIEMENIYK